MMTIKLNLKPKAGNDLEKIYNYSYKNFGKKKGIEYIKDITQAFDSLLSNVNIALKCDYIQPKLLKLIVNSHVIFFHNDKNEIVIVRILHQSQDYSRHVISPHIS